VNRYALATGLLLVTLSGGTPSESVLAADSTKASPATPAGALPDTAAIPNIGLRIQVQAGTPPKPVQGATVRLVAKGGKTPLERETTTNSKGLAGFEKIPQGKVVIQVTAKDWKTHGKEYAVQKDQAPLMITLEPDSTKP
jgi:hypothetical protein